MTIKDSVTMPGGGGPTPGNASAHANRRRWIALVVVCLAMFMNALDGSIVNVALPAIQRSLHFSQSGLTWVVDAYLISFGSFLLMAGRLGDLIGRKKVFLAGVTLFVLASIACGSADSQAMLITARFIQGIGGALSSSVIVAIIVTEFPSPLERGKAMSAYVFVAVGVLTQFLSWHWIFFVNVPIGIATLILGRFLIVENVGLGIKQGVDWVGSALITLSVMVAIYGVVTATTYGWASAHTLGILGLAIVLFVFFMVLESRLANPIMPLRILKLRTLTSTAAIRGLLITGMFSTFFIGALYFEHVLGYSPVKTGLAFLPQALFMAALSTGITAKLVDRFGAKIVMYPGMAMAAVGLVLFGAAGEHASYFPQIFIGFLLLGAGAGLSFMPLLQIGMSEVPSEDAGLGSGVVNVSQQMAGAIGLAFLSTIAANQTKSLIADGHSAIHSLTVGYQLALYIAAGCVLLGLLVSPFLLRTNESAEDQKRHIEENMRNPETREHLIL